MGSPAFLIIYSLLIIQLIYFLISSICYIYHHREYTAFWAAFCMKPPSNIKVHQMDPIANKIPSSTTSSSHGSLPCIMINNNLTTSHIDTKQKYVVGQSTDFSLDSKHIYTKWTSFIHYGLETLSHCILMEIYILCLLLLLCFRMIVQYVTQNSLWDQYKVFCAFVFKVYGLLHIPHHLLLICFCIPALKVQYTYNIAHRNKCRRMFVMVSIVFMIVFMILSIVTSMLLNVGTRYEVTQYKGTSTCAPNGGIGRNTVYLACNHFAYILNLILCFIVVIVPIYEQRKMLMNLPKNEENKELVELIIKVNKMSKRVCVSAVIMMSALIGIARLYDFFAFNPEIKPFLSIALWSCYVEGYIFSILIYKDWRIRLCSLCYYKHIRVGCQCIKFHDGLSDNICNAMETELLTESKDASSSIRNVPQLVRDVSKKQDNDDSF